MKWIKTNPHEKYYKDGPLLITDGKIIELVFPDTLKSSLKLKINEVTYYMPIELPK